MNAQIGFEGGDQLSDLFETFVNGRIRIVCYCKRCYLKGDIAVADMCNVVKTVPLCKPVGFKLILMGGSVAIDIFIYVIPKLVGSGACRPVFVVFGGHGECCKVRTAQYVKSCSGKIFHGSMVGLTEVFLGNHDGYGKIQSSQEYYLGVNLMFL